MYLEADDRFPGQGSRGGSALGSRPGSDPTRQRSGTVSNPIACSSAWPTRKSRFSPNCGPISCSPTGKPSERPHGMERPGSPARQDGIVRTSLRVHREWVRRARSDLECDRGRRRRDEEIELLERLAVLLDDQRPHPLRLPVEGVVVPGRERVRPEHDPALRLGAEALVARPVDHLLVARPLRTQPVAHAVVAREVRGRLRRCDQVVARHPVAHGARERALPHLRPQLLGERDRLVDGLPHSGLDALRFVQLGRHAHTHPGERVALGKHDGARQLGRRRVIRVASGDDRVQEGDVADGLRYRADLIEAGREGDDAVARDAPVGRAQADVPAQRRGLLDRAARVRAERPWRQARGHRRRRPTPRASGNTCGIPGVARIAPGRVLGRRPHRELVGVRLAQQRQTCCLDTRGDGRVEDGDVALEDPRARGRLHALRGDHVLQRDRYAAARALRGTQEAVQLAVAFLDCVEVRRPELRARELTLLEELLRSLGGQPQGVDYWRHAGTRKSPFSASGAFASTSSRGSESRGHPRPRRSRGRAGARSAPRPRGRARRRCRRRRGSSRGRS